MASAIETGKSIFWRVLAVLLWALAASLVVLLAAVVATGAGLPGLLGLVIPWLLHRAARWCWRWGRPLKPWERPEWNEVNE
jgi:hypothetical protein